MQAQINRSLERFEALRALELRLLVQHPVDVVHVTLLVLLTEIVVHLLCWHLSEGDVERQERILDLDHRSEATW